METFSVKTSNFPFHSLVSSIKSVLLLPITYIGTSTLRVYFHELRQGAVHSAQGITETTDDRLWYFTVSLYQSAIFMCTPQIM